MSSTLGLPSALNGELLDVPGAPLAMRCYRAIPAAGPAQGLAPMLLVHSVNAAASAAEVRPLYDHYRATRAVYALDLPGYGLSARDNIAYTPRLMTDAVRAAVAMVRAGHGDAPVDALAVSLGSEFLARAAMESPAAFRTLALVSPTGFSGSTRRDGPAGGTRAVPGLHAALSGPWAEALFRGLTRPGVIRYFLERSWGSKQIDEELWRYDVLTTRVPGARFAPLHFLSGGLFSADIGSLYAALRLPVWATMATRGDFTDYRQRRVLAARPNWQFQALDAGALPYFEPDAGFLPAYEAFLTGTPHPGT
jgi:pimeloyl-ACP methyl ester carboxylesterase